VSAPRRSIVRWWVPTALTVSAVCCFVPLASVAKADMPRLVLERTFRTEAGLGIAVDQASRDLFTTGWLNASTFEFGRSQKFDASGAVLPPSPFGEGADYGAAVNPVNGEVYVASALANEVDVYDQNTGELKSSFPVAQFGPLGFGAENAVEIAADSAGHVFVPSAPKHAVFEYGSEGKPEGELTGGGALVAPRGVAVDATGNLWVADGGDGRIVELNAVGAVIGGFNSEGVTAVALDPQGNVLATVINAADFCGSLAQPCAHLVEYSPAGVQLADLSAGNLGAPADANLPGIPSLLAVDESSGRVYVTDMGKDLVWVFSPPIAPKLDNELAAEVGASEAKLGAVVSPGGISAAYRFEYGTTTAYGRSVPSPEGDTGGGFQSRTVWAGTSGLRPGTTYHYRVTLTSPLGSVILGEDHTFTTETAAQAACPNEQLRRGFSANLPDCRAYELVTPPNKTSAEADPAEKDGDVEASFAGNLAAVDGNRLSYEAEDVFPGSSSASRSYVATRGTSGWSVENVYPPTNYYAYKCSDTLNTRLYSADLSEALILIGKVGIEPVGTPCGLTRELVSGEPKGVANLFVRDNTNGSYRLVDVAPAGVTPSGPTFVGASRKLDHIAFEDEGKLTSDATAGAKNLYEWSGDALRLPMKLADGTPVAGAFKGFSPDGSRAFFTNEGKLYARSNGTETVRLDASQVGGPGGGANLESASADGSQVLISDDASADLTADTAPGSGINLYKYDFASGQLTDLTPAGKVELKSVFGISEDGSYVYFEAFGSLAPGATQGHPNRYLWHTGTTSFLSVLTGVAFNQLRVSGNGLFVAFASAQKLTSYDNTDANTGNPDYEFYIYSATSNRLVCASCNPSGAPPVGGARVETHAARNLSESDRFFFETTEPLLPADTNGRQDVYEFEPDGVGSCSEPAGCVFLISTGTGTQDTWLIEASPSGNDVFLREDQKLVPRDTVEEFHTIYDVRVDGGFAGPSSPPPCTTPEVCRGAASLQPPIFGAPASQTFSGKGNLAPPIESKSKPPHVKCRKGFVKKRGKCVKHKTRKRARGTPAHARYRKSR
jgi:DNA-binding beta-propeller fold protein YncE